MTDESEDDTTAVSDDAENDLLTIQVVRPVSRPFVPVDISTVLRVAGVPALDVVLLASDYAVTGQAVDGDESAEILSRLRGVMLSPQLTEVARARLTFNAAGQLAFSLIERLISSGVMNGEGLGRFTAALQEVLENRNVG